MPNLFPLDELPKCPVHKSPMELVDRKHQTKEQLWCGVWYECAEAGCGCSTLLPSKELLELHNKTKAGVKCAE